MPNLNMTKEDVLRQLEKTRESLLERVNYECDAIKKEVEVTAQAHAGTIPHALTGLISTVNDFVVRDVPQGYGDNTVHQVSVTIGQSGSLCNNIPKFDLTPGRYRVFCHVHKMPD